MKNLFFIFLSAVFLISCSLITPVNDIEVHNNLINLMDRVKDSEQNFYQSYITLLPGQESPQLVSSFSEFQLSFLELDIFFNETKMANYQRILKESYDTYYKDFLSDYVSRSESFINEIKARGVVFEVINLYSMDLDQRSMNFIDFHNRFVEEINQQAND